MEEVLEVLKEMNTTLAYIYIFTVINFVVNVVGTIVRS